MVEYLANSGLKELLEKKRKFKPNSLYDLTASKYDASCTGCSGGCVGDDCHFCDYG